MPCVFLAFFFSFFGVVEVLERKNKHCCEVAVVLQGLPDGCLTGFHSDMGKSFRFIAVSFDTRVLSVFLLQGD